MRVRGSSQNGDGHPDKVTVIDWAYNNAGGGITAGQMTAAVPEPSTKALALLALDCAGVLAWRERRAQTQASDPAALTSPGRRAHPLRMSITATVQNGTITLPPGLDLPDGTTVEITLPEHPAPAARPSATLAWMLAFAGTVDGPADLAAEHDHYLHGTPRRGGE